MRDLTPRRLRTGLHLTALGAGVAAVATLAACGNGAAGAGAGGFGAFGANLGARRLSSAAIRGLLGVVLGVASVKMLILAAGGG